MRGHCRGKEKHDRVYTGDTGPMACAFLHYLQATLVDEAAWR